jgi:hypothetical protein
VLVSPRLPVLFGGLALLFFIHSCRSREIQPIGGDSNETGPSELFDPGSLQSVKQKHKENFIQGKKLEEEAEWLRMRLQMVEAEMHATLVRGTELKLRMEMAKYGQINERIPGEEGFINDRQRAIWDARMDITREEYRYAQAKVRLLQRDLDEIRERLAERGRYAPQNSIFR